MRTKTVQVKSCLWNYKSLYNKNSDYKADVKDLIKVALKPCMRGVSVVYNNGYYKKPHGDRG